MLGFLQVQLITYSQLYIDDFSDHAVCNAAIYADDTTYMQLGSNLCQGLDLGSELKYNLHGTVNKGKG